ncbi:hypothetical protein [Nostoc sp. 106C]|nr:hypothetical protein [Nostoc sp. 106C]
MSVQIPLIAIALQPFGHLPAGIPYPTGKPNSEREAAFQASTLHSLRTY